MAPIDRPEFTKECITQGTAFGAWAHYIVSVALLRSTIDDAAKENQFGPFMLTQQQWDAYIANHPDLGLVSNEIKDWAAQCLFFASWTHEEHKGLTSATGQNPTAEEIYVRQFPGESVAGLNQALTDTKDLMPGNQKVADANTTIPVKPPA